MFLVNSRLGLFAATHFGSWSKSTHLPWAPLLPKLRGQFAEFLSEDSLKRLSILYLSTCVGLRYGHLSNSLRGFSRQCGICQFSPYGDPHHPSALTDVRICLHIPPTGLNRVIHHPDGIASCVTPSVITLLRWYRNINLFPITYAFRPRLRGRLTLGGLTFPRKP